MKCSIFPFCVVLLFLMQPGAVKAESKWEKIPADSSRISLSMAEFENAKIMTHIIEHPRFVTHMFVARGRSGHFAGFYLDEAKRSRGRKGNQIKRYLDNESVGEFWVKLIQKKDYAIEWGDQFEIETQFGNMEYRLFSLTLTKKDIPPINCMAFNRGFDPGPRARVRKAVTGILCLPRLETFTGNIVVRFVESINIKGYQRH